VTSQHPHIDPDSVRRLVERVSPILLAVSGLIKDEAQKLWLAGDCGLSLTVAERNVVDSLDEAQRWIDSNSGSVRVMNLMIESLDHYFPLEGENDDE
jgi:hypothetical protein